MDIQNPKTTEFVIERGINNRIYTVKIDGAIIGNCASKYSAKKLIKKYIKNNMSTRKIVWRKTIRH